MGCVITDVDTFLKNLLLQKVVSVDLDTGQIIETNEVVYRTNEKRKCLYTTRLITGKFQGYSYVLKTTWYKDLVNGADLGKSSWLEITGSIHSNHFGGKNVERYTIDQLHSQIEAIATAFGIDPSFLQIHTIEIGINLYVLFAVYPFLKNCLLQFNNKSFDRMGRIGFHIEDRSQAIPKLYAKDARVLRWELKYIKMQPVLKHLRLEKVGLFLADLADTRILNELFELLLKSWDQVLLCDDSIIINDLPLTTADKELMKLGSLKDYWTKLKGNGSKDYEHFRYKKDRFTTLTKRYGNDMHNQIRNLLINEYDLLSKLYRNLPAVKNEEIPDFTSSMGGSNRELDIIQDQITDPVIININKGSKGKDGANCCRCCGADISHQKKGSKYCSAKFVGEIVAKRHRNNISNKVNNPKRKRVKPIDIVISNAERMSLAMAKLKTIRDRISNKKLLIT